MIPAYVYVVESPGAEDAFEGRTEGRALCEALQLSEVKHSYTVCLNKDTFRDAFALGQNTRFSSEIIRHNPNRMAGEFFWPIIHISAHGCEDGICLSDGDSLNWLELASILSPINDALPEGVLVCFSSCSGGFSTQMSMQDRGIKPFGGIVGTFEKVAWSDALVGFVTLYHHLFKGSPLNTAVDAMKSASGHQTFFFETGTDSFHRLDFYLRSRSENGFAAALGGEN